MAEATRAEKIGSLHKKICDMAEGFDRDLAALFEDADGVTDELVLAGQDGEVIRLRLSAERLTGVARAAALAKAGRAP